MSRTKGKSTVPPQMADEWLTLKETGQSNPTKIAKDFGWDLRTVIKALNDAQSRREYKAGRASFYRWAVEEHQKDLINFAKEINEQIEKYDRILPEVKEKPMWKALSQHIPNSPLWKSIKTIEKLDADVSAIGEQPDIKEKIMGIINERTKGMPGFKPYGISAAILQTIGWPSVDLSEIKLHSSESEPDIFTVWYNGTYCSETLDKWGAQKIQSEIVAIVEEAEKWIVSQNLRSYWQKRSQHKIKAQDELETIILRRIISGQCRYCPE